MKLRRNEFCPIHRSLYCCGREGETSKRERREKKYIAPPLTTTYCRFSIHPRVLVRGGDPLRLLPTHTGTDGVAD